MLTTPSQHLEFTAKLLALTLMLESRSPATHFGQSHAACCCVLLKKSGLAGSAASQTGGGDCRPRQCCFLKAGKACSARVPIECARISTSSTSRNSCSANTPRCCHEQRANSQNTKPTPQCCLEPHVASCSPLARLRSNLVGQTTTIRQHPARTE